MIDSGNGAEETSSMIVKCARVTLMELLPILTARSTSLKLKVKVYHTCVQGVLVYDRKRDMGNEGRGYSKGRNN
jgi:hypothetical protein